LPLFTEFLEEKKFECVVKKWLNELTSEDQSEYAVLESKYRAGAKIDISKVYNKLLDGTAYLPFKLTSFRTHIKGVCTCQRN
jgi:hypothetical protein